MTWQDRLKEASYTSPSGIRMVFAYEDVSKNISKKGVAFEFPDVNGTYIQQSGNSGRRYPLRIFFSGDNHDLESNQFESLLLENGVGILEHPVWGNVNVVPFGNITFRNDLKTASNQTRIELTFWDTIGLVYPINQSDPTSEIKTSIQEYNDASSELFEQNIDLDSEVKKVVFKNDYTVLLNNVSSTTKSITSVQKDIQKEFNAISDSINNSIDVLIGAPLTLAFQTLILLQTPARVKTAISDRLNAYGNLLKSITTKSLITDKSKGVNVFYGRDLYASTYVTGSIISVINNQFTTKVGAIETAENLIDQMDSLVTWRDNNLESLTLIDTGESYQKLVDSLTLTVGFLVQLSFSLQQERFIVLESNRTLIDLMGELYPIDVDINNEMDFFIQSNDLTGSEILELPRGRKIVYYV